MTSDPTSEAIRGRSLDVLLGVLGGHVGVVWRAKRVAGGPSERSEFTSGVLAVAAEGSGLRVMDDTVGYITYGKYKLTCM